MNEELIVSLITQLPVVGVFLFFLQLAHKQYTKTFTDFAAFFNGLRAEDQQVTEKIIGSVSSLEKQVDNLATMLVRHDEMSRQSFNVYLSRDLKDQQDEFERQKK